ncbi:MAG: Holliday junction branch migration protein RuvA [Psychromonas sp.]|nr:Holliday junction branch migration protein RuvA [Psychromonas sp.]
MIGRLRGTLLEKQPPEILLDVTGVGYEVKLPMSSFYLLPSIGQEAIIYTHFVVREDAQVLYGFSDTHERAMFRELIKVNGVGPKLALAILSGMTADQFAQCIYNDAISILIKLPGVGKKTAERLLIEMKDRLKNWGSSNTLTLASQKRDVDTGLGEMITANNAKEEAIIGLVTLGYKRAIAEKTIKQIYESNMDCEALIRRALKGLL